MNLQPTNSKKLKFLTFLLQFYICNNILPYCNNISPLQYDYFLVVFVYFFKFLHIRTEPNPDLEESDSNPTRKFVKPEWSLILKSKKLHTRKNHYVPERIHEYSYLTDYVRKLKSYLLNVLNFCHRWRKFIQTCEIIIVNT